MVISPSDCLLWAYLLNSICHVCMAISFCRTTKFMATAASHIVQLSGVVAWNSVVTENIDDGKKGICQYKHGNNAIIEAHMIRNSIEIWLHNHDTTRCTQGCKNLQPYLLQVVKLTHLPPFPDPSSWCLKKKSTRNMNVMATWKHDNHAMNFINFNHFHWFHDLNIFPGVHPNPICCHRFEQKVAHGQKPQVVQPWDVSHVPPKMNLRCCMLMFDSGVWFFGCILDVGVLNFCHVDLRPFKKEKSEAAGWHIVSLKQPLCKVFCG